MAWASAATLQRGTRCPSDGAPSQPGSGRACPEVVPETASAGWPFSFPLGFRTCSCPSCPCGTDSKCRFLREEQQRAGGGTAEASAGSGLGQVGGRTSALPPCRCGCGRMGGTARGKEGSKTCRGPEPFTGPRLVATSQGAPCR